MLRVIMTITVQRSAKGGAGLDKRIVLALLLTVCLALAGVGSVLLDGIANPALNRELPDYQIRITEICTKNESVLADNDGKFRDYIELYNPGPEIDLAGCRLTDGNVTSKPLDTFVIPAGGYRLLFLGDTLTGFGLSASGGDCIQLLDPAGGILFQTNTTTLATDQVMLYRDGGYSVSDTPSPGFANDLAGVTAFRTGEQRESALVIHELLLENESALPDSSGAFCDVVELYNRGESPLSLGGWCLSDSLEQRFRYRLPDRILQPGEYLLIFCDGENYVNQDGEIHTNFALSSGEVLCLTAADGSYGAVCVEFPGADVSMVRTDEGTYQPGGVSLGYPNDEAGEISFAQTRLDPDAALQISEVLLSAAGIPYEGAFQDVVEIQNVSSRLVSTRGWYMSDDSDPFAYALPERTLEPGACLVIVCGEETTGFSLSRMEQLRLMGPNRKFAPSVSCAMSQYGRSICLLDDLYSSTGPSIGFSNDSQGQTDFARSQLPKSLMISEVMSNNASYLRGPYANTCDWVELYNASEEAILLSEYALSDTEEVLGLYPLPEQALEPGEYCVLFLSEDGRNLHSDYPVLPGALSADGEPLYLSKGGQIVDYVLLPSLSQDAAYGRSDGIWQVLSRPTPERENAAPAAVCAAPVAVTAQGVYDGVEYLDIELSGEGTIYYTTDATEPNRRDKVYTGPIRVTETTVIRAICMAPGKKNSQITDLTYLLNENDHLPVVTIVSDPANFFSAETGIYVYGLNYEPVEPYRGANFWQDWEREATVSLFENDGTGFTSPCSVTIYGAFSRYQPKKSLALHFRAKYGASELEYPLFGQEGVSTYEAFVLRAGGQDSFRARIRDELITSLAAEYTDIAVQKYRPAVLYINGEYYGLHFIREKINEHFIAANYHVRAEDVTLARGSGSDCDAYEALEEYAATHDLTKQEYYDALAEMMDIEQYMDYIIAQICIGNDDNSNVRFFTTKGGKWRWILYDTDLSLYNPDYNSVQQHLNPYGTGAADYLSTVIINALLKNQDFKEAFLRRLAWQMDNIWTPENLHSRIDAMVAQIAPDMPKDMARWYDTQAHWDRYLGILRNYVDHRYEMLIPQVQTYFHLTDAQMREYGFRV